MLQGRIHEIVAESFDKSNELLGRFIVERIGHKAGKHHGAANGQRPARPPQVQRGDVSVADGFVAHAFG